MEHQPYRTCERIQNKTKIKLCHIQIDHAFYCTRSMVSLKDGFTAWRLSQKEDDVWSWRNPIFFLKNKY